MIRPNSSENAVWASSKETPCLRRFVAFFLGSHSNRKFFTWQV
jgi:hypothetical protein